MARRYGPRTPEGYVAPVWTAEETAYLRENYPKIPAKEIAAHLGRTHNAIIRRAYELKLKSRQRAGANSLVPGYFRIIDTPMKAYLLGLLTADGSISPANQLKLEIHRKDRCLAELARAEIAPKARIGSYQYKKSPMVRFMVQNAALAADLAQHGVVNCKTLITTWPAELPVEFENSYVCGIYDGDGSLDPEWIYRWSVVSGNPEFLVVMQAHIFANTRIRVGGPYRDKRHENAWSIIATGRPVQELDAWVHHDVPGLARKRLGGQDHVPVEPERSLFWTP